MKSTITTENGKSIITIEGRIDTLTATDFLKEIEPLMNIENPDIEINCKKLEYISSSGLRALLSLQKSVSANGGKLVLLHTAPAINEVFKITGFSSIFTII
ncbi:MAG: STAS domain-containing protein [Bacteroidales bacterium]